MESEFLKSLKLEKWAETKYYAKVKWEPCI